MHEGRYGTRARSPRAYSKTARSLVTGEMCYINRIRNVLEAGAARRQLLLYIPSAQS